MLTAQRLHSPCCREAQSRSSLDGQVYLVHIELDTVGVRYGTVRVEFDARVIDET